jgi:hypothetical protein
MPVAADAYDADLTNAVSHAFTCLADTFGDQAPYPHRIAHAATIGCNLKPVPLTVLRARYLLRPGIVDNRPYRRRPNVYRQGERVPDV